MLDVLEAAKRSGMVCHRTDLHEMRDVVLRQLLRLFAATLGNHCALQAADSPAHGLGFERETATEAGSVGTSPREIYAAKRPRSNPVKQSIRFLEPLRMSRNPNFVQPLLWTPVLSDSVRRLVNAELEERGGVSPAVSARL